MTESKEMPIRSRYIADRVLVMLLYTEHTDGVFERQPDGSVFIKLGPFSRSIKLSSTRLLDQLNWLSTMGLLTSISLTDRWGWAHVSVKAPVGGPA